MVIPIGKTNGSIESMTKFRCKVSKMRWGFRRGFAIGCVMWTCFACNDKAATTPSRADCQKVAEHIADIIVAEAVADPPALFDRVGASGGETGIPATVTRDGFKAWLETPEGKTWMMQRRGQTLAGTQQGVNSCVEKGTKATVDCLLVAKSKSDVDACDRLAKK